MVFYKPWFWSIYFPFYFLLTHHHFTNWTNWDQPERAHFFSSSILALFFFFLLFSSSFLFFTNKTASSIKELYSYKNTMNYDDSLSLLFWFMILNIWRWWNHKKYQIEDLNIVASIEDQLSHIYLMKCSE